VIEVAEGQVSLNLGAFVEATKQRLEARGVDIARLVPEVEASFVLFQSPELARAQRAVDMLDRLATILPFVVILLTLVALFVAPSPRTALMATGIAVAIVTAGLLLGLTIGTNLYIDALPPRVDPLAARAVIDALLAPLQTSLRLVVILGLIMSLVAWAIGTSSAARTIRAWVRDRFRREGMQPYSSSADKYP
jgi:hypothetical protein